VSTQRLAIVDAAVRTKLFLDHVDCFLMQQESLVNRKRKTVIPALRERERLVDSLNRSLSLLGLERQQKPIKSLSEYVAEKYGDGKVPGNGQGEDGCHSSDSPADEVNAKDANEK